VRPPLTGERMPSAADFSAQLSGPQESVTALRKLRMVTPGLRAGAGPTAGASRAGLIECDLALAVVQNCSQLRYFSRGTGTVCFQTARREGSPERNAQQPGAVGLDVGYSQRIELVDGDGSSRIRKTRRCILTKVAYRGWRSAL